MSKNKTLRKFDNELIKFVKRSKHFHDDPNISIKEVKMGFDCATRIHRGFIKYNIKDLYNIINIILNSDVYGSRITANSLQQLILTQMYKFYDYKKSARKIVNKVVQTIRRCPEERLCIIPIIGLNINNFVRIGFVTFYNKKFERKVISNNINESISQLKLSNFGQNLSINKFNFATVKVRAITKEGALKLALSIIHSVLNLLLVENSTIPNKQYSLMIGNKYVDYGFNSFLTISKYKQITHSFRNRLKHFLIWYPSKTINDISNSNYSKVLMLILHKIVNMKKLTPMEYGFYNSNNLIASGINTDYKPVKFIEFTSALEALLENKSPNITNDISRKIAILLGLNTANRIKLYEKMQHLYDVRSRIVHGSDFKILSYDLDSIWSISKSIIEVLANHFKTFNDSRNHPKSQLNKYIRDQSFN